MVMDRTIGPRYPPWRTRFLDCLGSLPAVLIRKAIPLIGALAIVVAACTGSTESTTTTGGSDATTTTTAPAPETTASTTTTTVEIPGSASASLDPAVVEQMREELAGLMVDTEEVRGLPFLSTPEVVILDEAEFAARVNELFASELDEAELAGDARFYEMLGMLPEGTDLYSLFVDLYTEQVAGYYDPDETELVVPAAADGFTPLQRMTVVHELIHALTDQHFEISVPYADLAENGNGDDATALLAVTEGDAQHGSFVYLESFSPADAIAAVTEALTIDTSVIDSAPQWLEKDLLFPYEEGLVFVQALIGDAGLAAVDQVYVDPPTTTEQILDYDKFSIEEGPRPLTPTPVDLQGWSAHDEGALGEWGLRLILGESNSSGDATQAAAGWGNDHYRTFLRGDDVAFALQYLGDSERDAEELANALITHVGTAMDAGAPVESGDGLLYDQAGVYAFIDRVGEEVFFVASTDHVAGADLRNQLGR
jgi:hypothetical protein